MSDQSHLAIANQIHASLENFSQELTPATISKLEEKVLDLEQVECPVIHRFAPGIYMRELHMKAGTFAIGHHQKTEHLNLFLKGSVIVFNEDGTQTQLDAPMCFVSGAGRKVGYVISDMVWINVYATNETDIAKLEETYLSKSDQFSDLVNQAKNESNHDEDRLDFYAAIAELGFTAEQVKEQSENTSDLTDMPFGAYKIQTSKSEISGVGVFATANISSGEIIAPALIDFKRTIAGRYANHAKLPNAEIRISGFGRANLIAIRDISGCKGGQLGEEITVDYRQVVRENQKFIEGKSCQE